MFQPLIWLLFIVTVSAELRGYQDVPGDQLYVEGNELVESAADDQPSADEYWRRNQYLYKLMKFLQRDHDARYEDETSDQTWSDLPIMKEPGVKKWLSIFNSNAAKFRPQRKWKIKKGKGPTLCYFKLCSFLYLQLKNNMFQLSVVYEKCKIHINNAKIRNLLTFGT